MASPVSKEETEGPKGPAAALAEARAALAQGAPLTALVRLADISGEECENCANEACTMYLEMHGALLMSFDDALLFAKVQLKPDFDDGTDAYARQKQAQVLHECLACMSVFNGVTALKVIRDRRLSSTALWTTNKMEMLRLALKHGQMDTAKYLKSVLVDDLAILLAYRDDTKALVNEFYHEAKWTKSAAVKELATTIAAQIFIERGMRSPKPAQRADAYTRVLAKITTPTEYLLLFHQHLEKEVEDMTEHMRLVICRNVARENLVTAGYLLEGTETAKPFVAVNAEGAKELDEWATQTPDADQWRGLVQNALALTEKRALKDK